MTIFQSPGNEPEALASLLWIRTQVFDSHRFT